MQSEKIKRDLLDYISPIQLGRNDDDSFLPLSNDKLSCVDATSWKNSRENRTTIPEYPLLLLIFFCLFIYNIVFCFLSLMTSEVCKLCESIIKES